MSKSLHLIYDEIGLIGSQLAGTKARAIFLWAGKHTDGHVAGIRAFAANDQLPIDWIPEREDAWMLADDKVCEARKGR